MGCVCMSEGGAGNTPLWTTTHCTHTYTHTLTQSDCVIYSEQEFYKVLHRNANDEGAILNYGLKKHTQISPMY